MANELPIKNVAQLETLLEEYLVKKAPALPPNIKEVIVKFSPYITLLLIIILLPAILALFGLGALVLPLSYLGGVGAGAGYTLAMIVAGVTLVLEVMALPGLFKRQLSSWRLLFYASLISAVSTLLQGNIVNAIISTAIGLYILFQVKSYYK